jgi:Concanavalin A-like lectin/glucanases superfamily
MAIQFPASAGGYTSTSGTPTTALFTIAFWFKIITSPPSLGIIWSLDSSSTQYCFFGYEPGLPALYYDWTGGGTSFLSGPNVSTATWYRAGLVVNGTSAIMYHATATGALGTYTAAGSFALPTGSLKLWLGDSAQGGFYMNFQLAGFKMWDAALSKSEVEQELAGYTPLRTANLNRWHPFVNKETTDYSGNARTLSGGTSATQVAGPPISWSRLRVQVIPWDPSTTVWYAHYDSTTGELLSLGTIQPDLTAAPGTSFLELLGQPDQSKFEWSTVARAFIWREGVNLVDRVADLLADGTLTAAWASLTGPESAAMQARIAQMLGPYRYRQSFQDVDLT